GRGGSTTSPATAATAEAAAEVDEVLIAWLEHMRRASRDRGRHLLERRDVVHDVKAASVRGEDDITVLERQIVHRHFRQVSLQAVPVGAIVGRQPQAALRSRDEQAALWRIFASDARTLVRDSILALNSRQAFA